MIIRGLMRWMCSRYAKKKKLRDRCRARARARERWIWIHLARNPLPGMRNRSRILHTTGPREPAIHQRDVRGLGWCIRGQVDLCAGHYKTALKHCRPKADARARSPNYSIEPERAYIRSNVYFNVSGRWPLRRAETERARVRVSRFLSRAIYCTFTARHGVPTYERNFRARGRGNTSLPNFPIYSRRTENFIYSF